MPFAICSTGDALALKVAAANQTSATCDRARGKDRGSARGSSLNFWGFRTPTPRDREFDNLAGALPHRNHRFIFAARYLAGQFLDAAPLICLIVWLGHKRPAATHEHNRACRSRIARCARSATAAADR